MLGHRTREVLKLTQHGDDAKDVCGAFRSMTKPTHAFVGSASTQMLNRWSFYALGVWPERVEQTQPTRMGQIVDMH